MVHERRAVLLDRKFDELAKEAPPYTASRPRDEIGAGN
jgi:hypothetical protein